MTRAFALCVVLLIGLGSPGIARQAQPARKGPLPGLLGRLADSLASSVAAGAIDSLLGQKLRGMLSSGNTPCVVRDPTTGSIASVVMGGPAGPGAAIVGAAKEAAGVKVATPAGVPGLPGASGGCPAGARPMGLGDVQALSAMGNGAALGLLSGAMPAGAAAVPGMPPGMPSTGAPPGGFGAAAAMTPIGVAAAAAPTAIKAGKAMGKLLGAGAMSAEDMARGLARGRLELKGVRFLPGSDELAEGADPVFQQLAEVLGGFRANYGLFIAPEAEKGVEPDPELAQRRVEKALALLLAAGIPEGVVMPGGAMPKEKLKDGKYPKLGEARLELIKLPKTP